MKTLALGLGVSLALVGCAPTLAGQLRGPAGEVVTSPEGRVNIVSLSSSAPSRVVVTTLDGDGEFATREELTPGAEYLVEALVPGYALASRRVRIGEDRRVALTLKPTARTKASAIGVNSGLDQGRGQGGATLMPPNL